MLASAAVMVCAAAADDPAGLLGEVDDAQGSALASAEVWVQSESTGARWKTQTDQNGHYEVAPLPPGRYKVTVRLPGFRTVSRVGAVLDSREGLRIDFAMELLSVHEVITVTSGTDSMDPSAASSLLMTRDTAGATLPANGGDYRVLFDLMPGVVTTPASTGDAGQFTSNGQRPNSHTFRVDGVSANTGVGSSILPGAFPGASLPAMTAIGSTENLVSNGTAQSIELRTSDFSPEFTDRPGAAALVSTRSGSNEFHGEFFGRIRDNGWNARDWFSNSQGLDLPRPFYQRLGLALGGPVLANRTFFFFSAEHSTLSDTGIQVTSVPSYEARQRASGKLQVLLGSCPPPLGPDLGGGQAAGLLLRSDDGLLLSTGLRVDQSLGGRGNLFFRVAESPSRSYMTRYNWASGTAGLTLGGMGGIHDLRFHYSRSDLLSSSYGGGQGNGYPAFAMAGLLPGFTVGPDGFLEYQPVDVPPASGLPPLNGIGSVIGLSVPGLGQFLSWGGGTAQQNQLELRETFARTVGRHQFRAGGDYVRLTPSRGSPTYAVLGAASSLEDLIEGRPLAVISSSPAQNGGRIHQVSVFAQDTFRVSERLSLLYGLGWSITPPTATELPIPTVSGLWTGSDWQNTYTGGINGAGPWPMRYGQVAPRLGLAYRFPVGGLVLRAGAGTFYDAALGAAVNPINGAPFNSWLLAAGGSGVDTSTGPSDGMGQSHGSGAPDVQRFLTGAYPSLKLPTSYQWRVSVERNLGSRGAGSIAYLGAMGRNLLGHQAYVDPATGVVQRMVTLTANSSNYQALQMRYSGSLLRNFYGSVSYTWAHSIDDGSQDSSVFLVHPGYRLSEARGSSSFDVRHVLTVAWSYRMPQLGPSSRLSPWLGGWTLSGTLRARTGFPIDVLVNDQPLGQGFDNVGRPNRVPGVPVWIADPAVAGHRRLNPAAFSRPAAGMQGTLGRNVITGNGLVQLDMSLRREFAIFRRISGEIGLNVFNVLNHPAFADPVPFLASPWFGQSTSMQNLMFGSGSPNTGMPPLFQTGGARSAEFSFRIAF
jgi:hypothetical protein